jgi:4-hydroxybenzoate polyprenyltransferase/phosphoserine phosphatase
MNHQAEILQTERPLVVDVDGTLIRTDLLAESFFALMSEAPLRGLAALATLRHGPAAFKQAVAVRIAVDVTALPYNETLLDHLTRERARGRRIYLASAAHETYVHDIAAHLGLFDGVFASNGETNLKGAAKSAALCATFGPHGFDYAGNATADLPVWQDAGGVIAVNASSNLLETVRQRFPQATVLSPRDTAWGPYIRALRPHQWLKNLLLLVPAFTAHRFDSAAALACFIAFLSFSLCASSVYLLNDLLDLRSDRAHPSKRHRPFAAGRIDLLHGTIMFAACLAASVLVAFALPWQFMLVLGVYYVLTGAYSTYLKRQAIVDVLTLACLYGIRLLAGATAVSVVVSPWLLMFSIFFFLCLALVKRAAEVIDRRDREAGDPPGRSYRLTDLPALMTMATTSGYVSVLVFILYVNSPVVAALYRVPETLWLIPVILLFWISRVLLLTQRGEMHDDPVLFAARDSTSLVCAALMACVVILGI